MLSDFARTVLTDFPIRGILDHLVLRIVELLPVDAAGVTLISFDDGPEEIAASNPTALRFERLQSELGEGPCVAAYDSDTAILVPDLRTEDRFPRFTESALAEGLVAVFTFPLRDGEAGIGALDLYRTTAGPLDAADLTAAQTLADVASAYLLNARARLALKVAAETERKSLAKFVEMDVAKAEFMASVIHELRTPMTSISGYTEILGDDGSLTDSQRRNVEVIGRNCRRLETLADDLLTLASFEPGAYAGRRVDLDFGALVEGVQADLEGVLVGRDLAVVVELPEPRVKLRGDSVQLERMVSNLMLNAVKFTGDGGWIRCAVRLEEGRAILEISDSGIGVPHHEQHLLFNRFFRSSTAHQHAIQGSGLGLAIVQATAHGHGGAVTMTSTPDKGSTFRVDLPASQKISAPTAPLG